MAIETKTTKSISITKTIVVDGVEVKTLSATINTENPEDISINPMTYNARLYKEQRVEIRKAEDAAEDEIYAEQDALLAGGAK